MAIDYKATSEATRRVLTRVGLSAGQATIYEALIHYGPQRATRLAFLAGVPRTLSYKHLEELNELGLVTKNEELGRVATFVPTHPLKLKELAQSRLEDARAATVLIEEALPNLVKGFDTLLGTLPESELYAQVAIYAGKAGLAPLSATEHAVLQKSLADLLKTL